MENFITVQSKEEIVKVKCCLKIAINKIKDRQSYLRLLTIVIMEISRRIFYFTRYLYSVHVIYMTIEVWSLK